MLGLGSNTRVFLRTGFTDGRLGYEGLRGLGSARRRSKRSPLRVLRWVLPKLAAASTRTATGLLPHHFAALAPEELNTTNHPILSGTEMSIEEFPYDRIDLSRLWQVGVEKERVPDTFPNVQTCVDTLCD